MSASNPRSRTKSHSSLHRPLFILIIAFVVVGVLAGVLALARSNAAAKLFRGQAVPGDEVTSAQGPQKSKAIESTVRRNTYPNLDVRVGGQDRLSRMAGARSQTVSDRARAQAAAIQKGLARLRASIPSAAAELSPITGAVEVLRSAQALTGPNPGRAGAEIVREFIEANNELYGLTKGDIDKLNFIGESVNRVSGLRMVRVEQVVNGLPVFQSESRFILDRDGRVVRSTGLMIPKAGEGAPSLDNLLSAQAALRSAMASVEISLDVNQMTLTERSANGTQAEVVANSSQILGNVPSKLVYFPLAPGVLIPAWSQITFTDGDADWYTLVDATNGELLWRKNIRSYASTHDARFSVYVQADGKTPADSPAPQSPTTAVTGGGTQFAEILRTTVNMLTVQDILASPNGWINDCPGGVCSATETQTIGNNVHAYLDRTSNNVPDTDAAGVIDANGKPTGNPDGSGRNRDFFGTTPRNYTMLPPPQGGAANAEVGQTATGAGSSGTNVFDAFRRGAITQLFYVCNWYHDRLFTLGFDEAAGNFQQTNFSGMGAGNDRVLAEAQDGGSTNNANFSTPPDGTSGRAQMYIFTGPTIDRDGDLDSEILVHELAHGTSNRLIGNAAGLSWSPGRSMGEGWSDFYALSLLNNTNADDPNGTYASGGYATYKAFGVVGYTDNYVYGIRRFPYSTNNSINPMTWADVDDVTNSLAGGIAADPLGFNSGGALEVHNAGEIWALTLWEVRSRIIAANANDVPTGNSKMLSIATDAMKMTPLNPSFTEARNAVIDADCAANACANEQSIWDGFADRGLGYNAIGSLKQEFGWRAGHIGIGESFLSPYLDFQSVTIDDSLGNNNGAIDPGEAIKITVGLKNPWRKASKGIASATATLTSATAGVVITDGNSTYPAIAAQGSANGDTFSFNVPGNATCGQSLQFTITPTSTLGSQAVNFVLRVGASAGTGAPVTYTRSALALAITDGAPRGVIDTLNITDDFEIADVNVRVDSLTHTWDGDVTFMVKGPNGYGTDLITATSGAVSSGGSSGDNFTNTLIDDQASSDLLTATSAQAPYTGSWIPAFNGVAWDGALAPHDPVGRLSRFNGTSTQGTWRVLVSDQVTPDPGTLNSWSLIVTPKAYTCTSNTAPTISAVGVTRQQGSPSANATIANVNDLESLETALTVTVNGGASATVNGVTVSGISVDAAGVVTADVVADCPAPTATFTLRVTDAGGLFNEATLTVTVNPNTAPSLTYASPQSVAFGGSLNVSPTTASDNGTITGYAVQAGHGLTTAPTVDASGVVSITNAQPAGPHTVTIRATDNCGTFTDAAFTLNVGVTPPTLGNYPNTTVQAGANTTVTPDAAPTSATRINVSTAGAFKGILAANPTTGVVMATNAHPAGTYLVTVTAFNGAGVTTTKTFTLTVTNPTLCGLLGFSGAVGSPFAVGAGPYSVAVGDFNGDGKQDLAAANYGTNNVTVLLGNGSGGFSPASASPFAVGWYPFSVAVGDFNGDGKLDLTTANDDSGNVTVLLGDGSGGFSEATGSPFSAGNNTDWVAVGDFNGDGKLDLTTASAGSGTVVLLGDGSGGFSAASGSPFTDGSGGPISVAVGDFNSDGKLDLTTANTSNKVSVLLGNGSGGFSPASGSPFAVGAGPQAVAVGDFNGDGKLDLTTPNYWPSNVTVLLGDGGGGFSPASGSPFAVGSGPRSVAVGDFNGDGKLDLTTANDVSRNVSMLLGDGSGGFSPASASPFAVGSTPWSVAVGDFNGDGKQDLTTANIDSNNVTVLLNTCTSITAPTISAVGVTRQQGSPSTNATIANVNDLEDLETALTVTINGGASATVNGVTVSGISVSPAGVVTADVVADCPAPTATFTLRVTDTGALFNEATLTVTVNPNTAPTLVYSSPQSVAFGGSLNVTPTTASDNGVVTYAVQAGHGLTTAPTVDASGVVSITNAQPAGAHTVTIRATDNCGAFADATFTLNVGALPTFAIDDVTHDEGNVGTTSYTFTVTKTGSTALNSSVDFATVDGTATTANSDYQSNSGTLPFLPADTTKTITILVNGDPTFEPDETFTVHLSGASGATISDADGTGTITNDDSAPTFAIDDVTHNEGNAGTTSYTFTVTRTGSTAVNSAVNFTTVDGSATIANNDYQLQSGTLNFLPTDTTKTITVLVNGDSAYETDEIFVVNLMNPVSATIADGQGTGTITNDDAAAGTWQTVGSLALARVDHSATLLQNGKVLVAGGYNPNFYNGNLTSAELYDPATATWSSTGSMNEGRSHHTATLLPNGKVLVTGGQGQGKLSSAEIYDPSTGIWTPTGSMNVVRLNHTATLLSNGKVLVTGGYPLEIRTELYDPATGTWSLTGSMSAGRDDHAAVRLLNGKVLVAGTSGGNSIVTTELYDPNTGTWTNTGDLNIDRHRPAATLLPNGKVLLLGGYRDGWGGQASAELYDPNTGQWTYTGSMATARIHPLTALLPNGKVMVVGGQGATTLVEVYDPGGGTWSLTGSLSSLRESPTATMLPDGSVLVASGAYYAMLTSAEVYRPAGGGWSGTGSMASSRLGHTVTLLPDGTVLAASGSPGYFGVVGTAERYNPGTGMWSSAGNLNTASRSHTATLLPNGKVLIAGGYDNSNTNYTRAELFDPAAGTWTLTASMNIARQEHGAVLLPNGKVLVAGGADSGFNFLASSELYDYGTAQDGSTAQWSVTGSFSTGRRFVTLTLLPNGKVLAAGGQGLNTSEIYDPQTGLWTLTGSMNVARWVHTATLLPNGKVLVAGSNGGVASAELYDPSSGTWTLTGSMNQGRYSHMATLLPDGRVLVTGGFSGGGLNSAEIYDPVSGQWTLMPAMGGYRELGAATILLDGRVLATGGDSSAELFDVGLGFNPAWRPILSTTTSPLGAGQALVATGSQFMGISEAHAGHSQSSATNYPLVQLRSLVNDQMMFLPLDSTVGWTGTSFTSLPVSNFPPGYALATVFTNAIPSISRIVLVSTPPDAAPTIAAATGLARQQGTPASNSPIATVTDDGGNGSVSVTVTSANPSNGVTISNIVNSGGIVTADIIANCSATNATFTLQASDGSSTATDALTVTVTANTAPALTYASPQSVVFGGSLNVSPSTTGDNGAVTYSVQSGHGLATAPTVNASGVVSITNAQPAGAHTVTIRATDNCGAFTDAAFTLNVGAVPTFSIDDVTHNEGNAGTTSYTFTVTKTGNTALDSAVNFTTVDGTATAANNDYQASSGTLNFLPADTSKTITVLVNGDTTFEPNEAFTVHLSGATNATIADADGTGTITNDDQNDVTINASGNLAAGTYNNVTINNCGTFVNMTGNVVITGTLTINDCAHLFTNNFTVSGSGAFVLAAGGWLHIGDANGITTSPTLSGSIQTTGGRSYSNTANYDYDGGGNQTAGNGLPATVNVLFISNTGTTPNNVVTGNTGQVVTTLLRVLQGVYVSASDYTDVDIAAAGTLSLAGPITVSGIWSNAGTFIPNGFGVTFDGAGNQTITTGGSGASKQFSGFTVSKSSGTATLAGALSAETFTITSGTFDTSAASSFAVTVSSNVSLTGGTFNANGSAISVGRDWTRTGTFTAGTSTVTFNSGTSFQFVTPTAFHNLTSNNTSVGNVMITGISMTITGNLTISTGLLTTQSSNFPLTIGGDFTNNGTFNAQEGMVIFNGNNNTQTISGSNHFNHLKINHTGTGGVTAAGSTLSVSGFTGLLEVVSGTFVSATAYQNVQIAAAGTLELSGPITVSGNWTNNGGTFTPGTFGVTFNGATGQTITGNTSFYDFTKSVSSAQQLNFTAGSTTTVTHALTLNGAPGQMLSLRSTSSGTQWKLHAPATQTVDYVDVKDSDASGGNSVAPTHSTSSGNNINWLFTSSVSDVAVDVSLTTIKKLNGADGTVAWSAAVPNDGALAMDQFDFGVYTANGSHTIAPGTVYKYNGNGGLAWTNTISLSGGCNFYRITGAAVDTSSSSPGVVWTETGCFGGIGKSDRSTGAQQWSVLTADISVPSIDPANGQIYDITTGGHSYNTIYSATTTGSLSSAGSCEGYTDLNPADGMLYRGGGACGLNLSQLNKSNLAVPNWTMAIPGITSFDTLAVQPWSGGYIYVVSTSSSKIVVVDPATQTVVSSFTTVTPPGNIAVNPAGGNVYVADGVSNFVRAYSPNGSLVWTSPDLGGRAYNVATLRGIVGTPPPTPTITVVGGPLTFADTPVGATSAEQTFTVAGSNLIGGITVTAPSTDFEVSKTTSTGFGPSVTFTQSGGTVPTATVFVHFKPQSTGPKTGNVSSASGGATTQNVGVSGTGTPAPGSITIVKDTIPDDAQDFFYTATGAGVSNFILDDDADGTLSNTQSFPDLAAGSRTITEAVAAGFTLTNIVCTGATSSTVTIGATGGFDPGDTSVTIDLAAGENVSCTFVNTKRGHIIVVKDAVPNDAQDFSFTNDFANGNPSPFLLDDDADGTLANSRDSEVLPGTYAVSEAAVGGWDQTSATCSDGSPVSAIVVSPGETVTCTFVNTRQADVTITKTDSPDPVTEGNNLTYTITVHNNGPGTATAVAMTDVLPPNTTFVSMTSTLVIPAGNDFFQSTPGSPPHNGTWIDFGTAPIPAGFFDPGSEPFDGTVYLGGGPSSPSDTLVTRFCPVLTNGELSGGARLGLVDTDPFCGGSGLGNTDTIVRRRAPAGVPLPGIAVIPIELVALNLVSVQPITVTYGGGPDRQWNVAVELPPGSQPTGQMNVTRTGENGGTFTSVLPVVSHLTFTPVLPGPPPVTAVRNDVFNGNGTFTQQNFNCTTPAVGANGTVACTGGTVDSFFDVFFTITVKPTHAAAGTTLSNTATVTANENDPDTSNNSATAETAVSLAPALGTYGSATVVLSGDTTVTPSAAPTDTTSINISTSTNFKGTFAANPTTGVITVTDAHPAGVYTVKVTPFNGSTPGTPQTFTLTVTDGTACAGVSLFTNPADSSVGSQPVSVAIGDFNNDGKQDIATANQGSNTVSIRLGDGLGGFTGTTNVSVGTSPFSVAVGDFNSDGKQDIAVANYLSNTVSIRLGNGLGGFSGATEVSVGSHPRSVAIGDFNNDGKQDIAAANYYPDTVSIRLGDGLGGFSGSAEVSVGIHPMSVAIGDFNSDGKQDIAAANYNSTTVSIRLGDGLGGFTGTTNVSVGNSPFSVAIGDFNNDGKQDIAVANESSSNVSIRLGDGLGGFTGTTNVSVGSAPYSVAIGDFNNDGKQDIAAANYYRDTVSIRLGDGLGGFSGSAEVSVGYNPFSVAIGDFNNDGKQDIAVANESSSNVSIRLGACNLPPTIAAATGLSRQQSTPVSNSQIATVTDDGGNGSVIVTVTSANPSSGVSVSNITNTGGNIAADIVADCTATTAAFTLQASDGSSTATDTLSVTVTANTVPTLTYPSPQPVIFGGTLNLSPATTGDNGAVTYSVQAGYGLATEPTVDPSGVVSITNAQPAGTHTVTIRATDNCGAFTDATFTLDVGAMPTFSIDNVTHSEGNSGTTAFVFTVTKNGSTGINLAVDFATVDGTATDNDYQANSGTLEFAPADTTKQLTVLVNGDTTYEPNEGFTVQLSGARVATSGAGLYRPSEAVGGSGTITNDDNPPATLVVNTADDIDDGFCTAAHCSLREAINAANFATDASTVNFDIPTGDPGFASGVYTIQPATALPVIANGRPATIDGTSQTAISNSNPDGPEIVLDGSLTSGESGLRLEASNSTVKGLVVNGFGTGILMIGTSNNQILDNYVGTNASGTAAVPNSGGLSLQISTSGTISGNLISGNSALGLATCNASNTTFSNNKIGTDRTGTLNVGNGGPGIRFDCSTGSNNTITGNTIAFNSTDGFRDVPDYRSGPTPHSNNRLTQNSIFENGGLGINLNPPPFGTIDGVTPNDPMDPDTGGNNLQNFPVITSAKVTGSTRTITGTLNTTPSSATGYTIEFFANTACDASGNGEGKTYLGSMTTGATDVNGDVGFIFHPASLTAGDIITATATDASNNTSEFSPCLTTTAGAAGEIKFSQPNYSVAENVAGGLAHITINRVGGSDGSVSATFNTSDGTATTGDNDYNAVSNFTVSFADGDTTPKTVDITINNDGTYEPDETVNLSLSGTTVNRPFGPNLPPLGDNATLTITNDDAAPTFAIDDVTHNEGNAGTTSYVFTVTKTGSTALNASVNFTTEDGTATTADNDYQGQAGTLDFLPAETTKTVTILVNGDTTFEATESFTVHLSGASGATIAAADGTGTVINDDLPSISGHISYAGGSTPGKNVTMTLTGTGGFVTRTTTSDNNGDYMFASVPVGNDYTVTPSKTGDVNGIQSFDAAFVARYVAGLDIPTAMQRMAADADGDGILTSLDAAFIARRAAGLPGVGIVGTWKFSPVNRAYPALGADQTGQNFTAILVGDASGDWTPALPAGGGDDNARVGVSPQSPEETAAVTVSLPHVTFPIGTNFTLPIAVGDMTGLGVKAYDLQITFDPLIVQPQGTPFDRAGTRSSGMLITPNATNPGHLVVSGFQTEDLSGSGTLINLKFTIVGAPGQVTSILFQDQTDPGTIFHPGFRFNAGTPGAVPTNGSITVNGPTAASARISGQIVTADGQPVSGATVTVLGGPSAIRAITDSNGFYQVENLEVGVFYTVTPSRANFAFAPASRSFSLMGNRTDAVFTGMPISPEGNPLESPEFFVRQQYLDFLGREPEQSGLDYWSGQLRSCGQNPDCVATRRLDISAAFFIAQEFQDSGLYIYDVYEGALGRRPDHAEYAVDRRSVVGGPRLEADKAAFALSFVERPEFSAQFPLTMSDEVFVDALLRTAQQSSGLDLNGSRAALVALYNTGTSTTESRSLVLRSVVEGSRFKQTQYNPAFVLMEYYGYLGRNPDRDGYDFWLNVLNESGRNGDGNNYRGMVCSFITSAEYQRRFSSVVTRSNTECGRIAAVRKGGRGNG